MRYFINTVRFANTVVHDNWLPEVAWERLWHPVKRVSPYGQGEVTVTVGMHHVEKSFSAPAHVLPQLLAIYDAIMGALLPNTIVVSYLKVGPFVTDICGGMSLNIVIVQVGQHFHKVGQTYQVAPDSQVVPIEIKLGPVGSRHKPGTADELMDLAIAVLEVLAALHPLGLVHRDIRRDNIIFYEGRWYVIDWELGGHIGQLLSYGIRRVPAAVAQRMRGYTEQDDLWQVRLRVGDELRNLKNCLNLSSAGGSAASRVQHPITER
jgi:serine/threonine protein kinase